MKKLPVKVCVAALKKGFKHKWYIGKLCKGARHQYKGVNHTIVVCVGTVQVCTSLIARHEYEYQGPDHRDLEKMMYLPWRTILSSKAPQCKGPHTPGLSSSLKVRSFCQLLCCGIGSRLGGESRGKPICKNGGGLGIDCAWRRDWQVSIIKNISLYLLDFFWFGRTASWAG